MLKRFCDLCNSEITGLEYRHITIAGPHDTIPTVEGQALNTYLPKTEVCMNCTHSIFRLIRGIESGGTASEVVEDG